jgi:hypothetical protein
MAYLSRSIFVGADDVRNFGKEFAEKMTFLHQTHIDFTAIAYVQNSL